VEQLRLGGLVFVGGDRAVIAQIAEPAQLVGDRG
jgi:hypothetical protein